VRPEEAPGLTRLIIRRGAMELQGLLFALVLGEGLCSLLLCGVLVLMHHGVISRLSPANSNNAVAARPRSGPSNSTLPPHLAVLMGATSFRRGSHRPVLSDHQPYNLPAGAAAAAAGARSFVPEGEDLPPYYGGNSSSTSVATGGAEGVEVVSSGPVTSAGTSAGSGDATGGGRISPARSQSFFSTSLPTVPRQVRACVFVCVRVRVRVCACACVCVCVRAHAQSCD